MAGIKIYVDNGFGLEVNERPDMSLRDAFLIHVKEPQNQGWLAVEDTKIGILYHRDNIVDSRVLIHHLSCKAMHNTDHGQGKQADKIRKCRLLNIHKS